MEIKKITMKAYKYYFTNRLQASSDEMRSINFPFGD
jgi:hypothetical protein